MPIPSLNLMLDMLSSPHFLGSMNLLIGAYAAKMFALYNPALFHDSMKSTCHI